jgi:hypothetical protein
MKVVVFRGIGSFALSKEAIQMLIEKHNIPVVDLNLDETTYIVPDPPYVVLITWKQPFSAYPGSFREKRYRSDPRLIDVVQTLGEKAWQSNDDPLEIVEIPDDIEW